MGYWGDFVTISVVDVETVVVVVTAAVVVVSAVEDVMDFPVVNDFAECVAVCVSVVIATVMFGFKVDVELSEETSATVTMSVLAP